ncbi:MAG: ATP-binding cassette domain-containing protein [Parabacteroides sp.]
MNETILNGLLNLFSIFASLVQIKKVEAQKAVHAYLTNHFGIRSHTEYMELFEELQDMYNDPDFAMDKKALIRNVCTQLRPKLRLEEQVLLLLRFMEFACQHNPVGYRESQDLFEEIAHIFQVPDTIYADLRAYVLGESRPTILTIGAEEQNDAFALSRPGLEGVIRVLLLRDFDRLLFTYIGKGILYLNDIPAMEGIFYSWQRSSVIKSPHFHPIYYSDVMDVFNRKAQKEPIKLTGRDIEFNFPSSSNGLHNFSFNLESGQLVAIMGGSGVGKSTLLSILNGNIRPQQGSICLNGHSIEEEACKQLIGFVPQDDLLIEELTVFQNLWYTARLCFAQLNEAQIKERVEAILRDLDLESISHLPVGSPIRKTISGGQRKRLNIALELIREPAILFLDEPTSGLSSSDSEKVIMLLKEQTHRGRLVIVNIHQPSSEIYKLFDRLWLLDAGGYPIYDGNPIEAITYFKRLANYTDQEVSVCSVCGNINPELILNIIDAKKIDETGNQTTIRKCTPQEWHELYTEARPVFEQPVVQPLPSHQQHKPSVWKQLWIFLERNVRTKITNKPYWIIALLEAPILALIVALLTRYSDEEGYTLLNNKNLISYLFMSVIVVTFMGMSISAEEIIKDRGLLKRERFLRLSRGSYLCSKICYLLMVSALQSLLFIVVGNTLIGIGSELFLTWWITLWVTSFLANLTGLWLSQTLNTVVSIYITIPLLLIPQILLSGLVVRFDDLSRRAADTNTVPLIGNVIPSRWAFEALVVEQYHSNAYFQPIFAIEREKYLAQYYANIHAVQVRNLINQMAWKSDTREEDRQTVQNELAVLARAAHVEPCGVGEEASVCLSRIEQALHERADNFAALLDKVQEKRIKEMGNDAFSQLRRDHHNRALEELVLNSGSACFYREADHRIYPKLGIVYLTPESNWGNAPFFSYEKRWAGQTVSTWHFNLFFLCFLALFVILFIFAEFPSRYFRKGNE